VLGAVEFWAVDDLAWSADGQVLAVAGYIDDHGEITLMDRAGHTLGTTVTPADIATPSVGLSLDGRLVAFTRARVSRNDPGAAVLTVWDWQADHVEHTIAGANGLEFVALDPNGRRAVVSGQLSGSAEVWDITTGKRLLTLAAPPLINDLTFSPDGATIATAHQDGTVRLWDAATGVERLQLHGHDDGVDAVAFSPDGSKLVSVGDDGLVRVWAVRLDDLLAIAAHRLTRGFSEAECRQYLHLAHCPSS
jgi:WD40 repeat protein